MCAGPARFAPCASRAECGARSGAGRWHAHAAFHSVLRRGGRYASAAARHSHRLDARRGAVLFCLFFCCFLRVVLGCTVVVAVGALSCWLLVEANCTFFVALFVLSCCCRGMRRFLLSLLLLKECWPSACMCVCTILCCRCYFCCLCCLLFCLFVCFKVFVRLGSFCGRAAAPQALHQDESGLLRCLSVSLGALFGPTCLSLRCAVC